MDSGIFFILRPPDIYTHREKPSSPSIARQPHTGGVCKRAVSLDKGVQASMALFSPKREKRQQRSFHNIGWLVKFLHYSSASVTRLCWVYYRTRLGKLQTSKKPLPAVPHQRYPVKSL